MIQRPYPRPRLAAAVAALLGATFFASVADAGNYDTGSLASQFLQSKTQITILGRDDRAAPNCSAKHFVKVNPQGEPTIEKIGAISERKWAEQWTLERCGTNVNYWVFFTEVGSGGAYYAIVDPQN
jgi:hypothetical protein